MLRGWALLLGSVAGLRVPTPVIMRVPTPVTVAVCTGSACEQRCTGTFDTHATFAACAADDDDISLVTVNCMNQCKRGPVVRIVAGPDELVQKVNGRMNSVEMKRGAFQNVGSVGRAEAIFGVAKGITDGSLSDGFGDFSVEPNGPLPPSAQ